MKLLTGEEYLEDLQKKMESLRESSLSEEEKEKRMDFLKGLYDSKKHLIENNEETWLSDFKGKRYRVERSRFMDCLCLD